MATAKIIFHSGGNLGDPPPSRITARPLSTEKEEFFKPSGSTPPPPLGSGTAGLDPFCSQRLVLWETLFFGADFPNYKFQVQPIWIGMDGRKSTPTMEHPSWRMRSMQWSM